MKNLLLIVLFVSTTFLSAAQSYDPLQSPTTYQSTTNPSYWKNRLPFDGYWQQDVHYRINAKMNEETDVITATLELNYFNNSPDELSEVFFHLYQNAFTEESYYAKNEKAASNDIVDTKRNKGTEIEQLLIDGKEANYSIDNTILKIKLDAPIKSGEKRTFSINFQTYVEASGGRRMTSYFAGNRKHYNVVHWYPRIAVYDRKFGWTTDQHLGSEFYGDFGTFDVEFDLPSNFVVGATGNLLNRNEVLPAELRELLSIKNFRKPVVPDSISVITPYTKGERKVWKYHAENVHDFALTANPSYRIGEAEWNGVKCYALAREENAHAWQLAAIYASRCIEVYSEDFGQYTYHKMIVADARDGMEYPMLTLDGGHDPDHRTLLAHEIGHNWFYGQVGTNETYRAMLDEGFTNFLTLWAIERIDGKFVPQDYGESIYETRYQRPELVRDSHAWSKYLYHAIRYQDPILSTHSNQFETGFDYNGGYRQVYYKTASMLLNLEYVLGDELFLSSMKNYFSQWKIAHPYVEDFRESMIRFTKVDLNWFFDQWLISDKRIDYSVGRIKRGELPGQFEIKIKRKGEMQMPIDFTVITTDNQEIKYHIPNTYFVKETDAKILPQWIGFGELNTDYVAKVEIPGKIKEVRIDPTRRLADMNVLNNTNKPSLKTDFDSKIKNKPSVDQYELYWRPDLWYNVYDGGKVGFHMNGNYLDYKHVFSMTLWLNTAIGQEVPLDLQNISGVENKYNTASINIEYRTGLNKWLSQSNLFGRVAVLDGLRLIRGGIEKKMRNRKDKLTISYQWMRRTGYDNRKYLLYPNDWGIDKNNSHLSIRFSKPIEAVNYKGLLEIGLQTSSFASDYSYGKLTASYVEKSNLGKLEWKNRLFAQLGTGDIWPAESKLFLAGGNPEEMMESKFYRSNIASGNEQIGLTEAPSSLHFGGGLNLRGYTGYLAPEVNSNGDLVFSYSGNSGFAWNTELEFDQLIPAKFGKLGNVFHLDLYAFFDAGLMNLKEKSGEFEFADLRTDAGIGTALTVKKWGYLKKIKPLTVRFDFPFFLNKYPNIETSATQFRWVMGISRAF